MKPIRAPSTRKKKVNKKQGKTYRTPYKKPYKKFQNNNQSSKIKTKTTRKPKYRKLKKKDNVCRRCGRPGPYANSCKVSQKINQIEDQKLKESLLNILINSEESNSPTEEEDSKLELEQIEQEISSGSIEEDHEDDYCLGPGLCDCTNCKSKNMLTKDQTSTLIFIIDKLEDSPLKNEFLKQLNNLITRS